MYNGLLILILFVSLLLSCGCVESNSYNDQEISFNYPSHWMTFTDFWPNTYGSPYKASIDRNLNATEIMGVLNPRTTSNQLKYSTSVKIEKKNMTNNLKDTFDQTYNSLKQDKGELYQEISQKTFMVDGVVAYEKVYKIPHGEPWFQVRDVWIEKNGMIYILSCWCIPEDFNKSQDDFNLIINSFHVK